jgi:hypothetical protein
MRTNTHVILVKITKPLQFFNTTHTTGVYDIISKIQILNFFILLNAEVGNSMAKTITEFDLIVLPSSQSNNHPKLKLFMDAPDLSYTCRVKKLTGLLLYCVQYSCTPTISPPMNSEP